MNTLTRLSLCFVAAFGAMLLTGCQQEHTRAEAKTNNVETSISQVQREIAGAKVQVEASNTNLQNLLNTQDEATLPARYQLFADSLENLKEQRGKLDQRADDMLDRRQQYLSDWRSTLEKLENPALRASAHERMANLSEQFSNIRQQVIEASFAMKPMIETLEGVESTLTYDLNLQALERVSTALSRTPLNTNQIHQQLSMAQEELSKLNDTAMASR